MRTAAVSKHDIWSRQGQADQEMSPPAGSATSASDQLQGRGKCVKPGADVFRASQGLRSHAVLNHVEDLLGPSARLPTGAQNGKDGAGLGARLSQQPGKAKSLVMMGKVFAFPRDLCSRLPAETPPHHSDPQAWEHHLSLAGSWGQTPALARSSLSALGVPVGQPFPASGSWCQLCHSLGHGRRQDPALLLPGLLA